MESDSTKATIGTAAALSIKLPQFWAHSPKLWFAQAEAQFALRQVSSSLTKFYYAVAALPDHIASDVNDLLNPEPLNPYEALKAKLLRRFDETQDQRLQKLLHWSPPADQKPSSHRAELDAFFGLVGPTPARSPLRPCWHVPRGLRTATHVFVRVDAQRPPLSPVYDGPFAVVTRTQKTLTLARNGRLETVSVDRVKPAFFSAESAPTDRSPSSLGAGYVAGATVLVT
ncbi:hypothetical protein M514_13380 [Trichuris suis]|uniref:DUF7041 domain-containing protein n=1 Tax=Trichuris suis TaxID=68888 RepID=A0A085NJW0_9BILA|nr:hypothetical protein M513_13380 [Trichuris suis]KFD69756.1 hypothetical protein M514_13380 [Trichuris suis]